MRFFLSFVLLMGSYLAVNTPARAAVGDVNYISDELNVPLRSGPSTAHRILHRGLPSGTRLTVLEINEGAGFTKVRTEGGMEGWLTSQYLTKEPIARVRLDAAEKRVQSLKTELDKEREARADIQSDYKETKANNEALTNQVQSLSQELEELKRISADPINEHARNLELTQQNQLLAQQVDELSTKNRQLKDNVQLEWLLYGGALVLIGLIIGVILKARPRQASYAGYRK